MQVKDFCRALAIFFPAVFASFAATEETITQEELVRRTQELFDAVVPGNAQPWKKYYADDCLYADEKTEI